MKNLHSRPRIFEWLLLFSSIAIFTGVIVQSKLHGMPAAAPNNGVSPSRSITPPIAGSSNICEAVYSKEISNLPPGKAELWINEYQNCLTALTVRPDSDFKKPTIRIQSTLAVHDSRYRRIAGSGVLAFGMNVPPGLKIATGEWFKIENDHLTVVIAGAKDDGIEDLSQGALAVIPYDQDYKTLPTGGIYPTPLKNGPVTIIDAINDTLVLVSEDGTLFSFDVTTREFVPQVLPLVQGKPQRPASQGFIIENGEISFSHGDYHFANQWFEENKTQRTTVFVGQSATTVNEGALIVVNSLGEPKSLEQSQVYNLPLKEGPYRIIDVSNNQVVVWSMSLSGGLTIFDLSARRFLSTQEITHYPTNALVATYESPIINRTPQPTITLMGTPERTKTVPAYP